MKKTRLWIAGLVAFLIGIPFTERVLADNGDSVRGATANFVNALIDASGGNS